MRKRALQVTSLLLAASLLLSACSPKKDDPDSSPGGDGYTNKENKYKPYTAVKNLEEGTVWPDGQFFPTFATPAAEVDTMNITSFKKDEQTTISALQGIVNKQKPRLLLLDSNPDEGAQTWPKTETVGLTRKSYKSSEKYDLIRKYKDEVKGVVLYSTEKSVHYRNLATTVAAIKEYLPMTQDVLDAYREAGIEFADVADLTQLNYTTPVEIYTHLYDVYWKDCSKRLLLSTEPEDLYHIRDIAAATKSAAVYLDCMKDEEKAVFEKFLKDMQPGNAAVMGWYTSERSGITTVTKYGLSTVPANFFMSGTIYAGTDHTIRIPAIPDKPALENKVYIAVYISDGDNIQYNQRYMRKLWEESKADRGKIPMNWTITPALADAAPAILNYYYETASDKECFVVGPSGLGYAMPVNTFEEEGAPTINFLENDELMKAYVNFTETYLQRSGLRVVTVWDNLTPSQRKIYTDNARYLYGLTVHDWHLKDTAASTVESDRLLVQQLIPCYGETKKEVVDLWTASIDQWDGTQPLFLAGQVSVWKEVKPRQILEIYEDLKEKYGDKVEFVRADHYYALYNEANGLPFDLTRSGELKATATSNSEKAALTVDGTPAGESIWVAAETGAQTLTYDLGGTYQINRYVLRHAGENGLDASLNTRNYVVEVSTDGTNWKVVDEYRNNTANVTDIDIESVEASQVRINITDAGSDGIARIADVEIYGSKK